MNPSLKLDTLQRIWGGCGLAISDLLTYQDGMGLHTLLQTHVKHQNLLVKNTSIVCRPINAFLKVLLSATIFYAVTMTMTITVPTAVWKQFL